MGSGHSGEGFHVGRRRFVLVALAAALLPLLARLGLKRGAPPPGRSPRPVAGHEARHWKRIA